MRDAMLSWLRPITYRLAAGPHAGESAPDGEARNGKSQILYALVRIAPLLLLSKFVSFGKEAVVAAYFGTGDAVDAFIVAFLLPAFAINVIGGSLTVAFVPTYIAVSRGEGRERAVRLLGGATLIVLGLLVTISAGLALGAREIMPVLGGAFGPAKLALSCSLLNLLLPVMILAGPAALWGGVLNAEGSFAIPAGAAMLGPLSAMAAVAISGRDAGIISLAIGSAIGSVCEVLVLGVALWRFHSIRALPSWSGVTPPIRTVSGQLVPIIVGSLFMSVTVVVDQAMAASVGSGSVAALSYGGKLIAFALGVGSVSLSAAVLPHFSRMAVLQDWRSLYRTLRMYSVMVFAGSVLLTVAGILGSKTLVEVVFQRGSFNAADAHLVSRVQTCYLLQLPFHLTGLLYQRFISSIRRNRVLLGVSMINLVVDVIGNVALLPRLGVAGIALSTSIVHLTSFAITGVFVWTWLRRALANVVHASDAEYGEVA